MGCPIAEAPLSPSVLLHTAFVFSPEILLASLPDQADTPGSILKKCQISKGLCTKPFIYAHDLQPSSHPFTTGETELQTS